MTTKLIEDRLQELREQLAALMAQANACSGAIQELEAWHRKAKETEVEEGNANVTNIKDGVTGTAA